MLTEWQLLVYVEQCNVPLVIWLVAVDVELCVVEASISDVQECRRQIRGRNFDIEICLLGRCL